MDEAQDLVGSRYELVKKILQNAHETCGWIVLGDPLQAIYEFTGQDEDEPEEVENATDSMHGVALYRMENLGHYTHHMRFTKDHRSKTPEQRELMEEAREATEEGEMSDLIREKLTAAKEYGISELHKTFQSDDDLLLFRTRGEVLAASSYFLQNQKRHRIRLSGVGDHVESWIGSVFQHFDHPVPDTVRKSLFLDAYARAFPDCATGSSRWDQLLELAKKTEQSDRLDVRKLKQLISKPRPPVELSMLDGGSEGPTLGTIHASKGRESENVVTFFPSKFDSSDSAEDPEEEERILYVATTRARSQFSAAQMDTNKNTKSVQGRCYKSISPKKYQRKIIEVGRSGDSNPLMMAAFIATRAHLESSDVQKALNDWQERLNKLLADDQFPVAMSGGLNQPLLPETKRDYVFEVQAERKKGSSVLRRTDSLSSCFGCISLGRDVFLNGNAKSAVSLHFPYITGVGTYALPREPDDKQRGLIEQLDGWEETVSRIWLYPIFRGFCLYNHR